MTISPHSVDMGDFFVSDTGSISRKNIRKKNDCPEIMHLKQYVVELGARKSPFLDRKRGSSENQVIQLAEAQENIRKIKYTA
nr:hypothetical protein [Gluconobacter thailandicus]